MDSILGFRCLKNKPKIHEYQLSFSKKTNEKDGKWTIIWRTNDINVFERLKKEQNGLFTNNEQTKWKKNEMKKAKQVSLLTSPSLNKSISKQVHL